MKHFSRVISFVAVTALLCAQAHSQEAPLGLTWGFSIADARQRGIELTDLDGTSFGKSFVAMKVDRAVADQEASILSFGFNDKLWRVVISSKTFKNDPSGSAVLARYDELSSVLAEKYGKPKTAHRLGGSIYSESKYFVAGIRGGESNWFSNFETPTLWIQLGLFASDSSTSRWRIIYEHKAMKKEFEASKRTREKGSL